MYIVFIDCVPVYVRVCVCMFLDSVKVTGCTSSHHENMPI